MKIEIYYDFSREITVFRDFPVSAAILDRIDDYRLMKADAELLSSI
jgi:hypothetical protein